MEQKKCEVPGCEGTLVKMEHESSWTIEKYHCSQFKCGRVYHIPTTTGKVAQLAPLATLGLLAISILTLDLDGVLRHGSDAVDNLS